MVGVVGDINRQKQDEEELHRLRNYLTTIIDPMPSVLIGVDAEGNTPSGTAKPGE